MNYKKIIPSRGLRNKILSLLNWIPDSVMIPLQYRIHTGRKLNLKNPQRFTEKLQVYKLKYRNKEMLRCTDKYTVRDYVKEKGLEDILIPLIGVYNDINDIDFELLPKQFVAKTSDGGGGNQVFICRNKDELDKSVFYAKLKSWMTQPKPKKQVGREWAYENGQPRTIIIEELISDSVHKDIPDYKFYCFDGTPRYCQVIADRTSKETIDFFDMNWNHMPFYGLNPICRPSNNAIERPKNFDKMKDAAKRLSKAFPFSRIDFYTVENNIFFGEVTFYPASGYGSFTPDEWDYNLGELLNIQFITSDRGGVKIDIQDNIEISPIETNLIDYKFFCFNGIVRFVYGISDRHCGETAKIGIYDRNFNKLNVYRTDERPQETTLLKPVNYDRMLKIAERLSGTFPEVRVDLYNINGKIYFGELTFYDGSGYMCFHPDSFDFKAGNFFDISSFTQ